MSVVRVGSARHDENGKLKGGKAGDQTGHEVETQKWYKHSKGWVVIRPKSAEDREKIARNMEYACANDNIGYDQSQNTTLFAEAKKVGFDCSKVKTKCETDCSRLVRVCLWYAGIQVGGFYTGDQVEVLEKTGRFDILRTARYTDSPDYLLRGDILVTKTTGHTVVVLDDGPKAAPQPAKHKPLNKGDSGAEVKELQGTLNFFGYRDATGSRLKEDGKYGVKTAAAVRALQKDRGLQAVDGICGTATWTCIDNMKKEVRQVRLKSNSYLRPEPKTGSPRIKILKAGNQYSAARGTAWVFLSEPDGWVPGKKLEYLD